MTRSLARVSFMEFLCNPIHFCSLSFGEGNGNPLQCSCLENPRDGRAWWAAVCGVAQSQTGLKLLSSSSSSFGIFVVSLNISFNYVFMLLFFPL